MTNAFKGFSDKEARIAIALIDLQEEIFRLKMYPWYGGIALLALCAIGYFVLPAFWLVMYRLIFIIVATVFYFVFHARSKLDKHAERCHRALLDNAYASVVQKMEESNPKEFSALKEFVNERRGTNM